MERGKLFRFSSSYLKKMEITSIAEKSLDLFEEASSQIIKDLLDKRDSAEAKLAELTSQLSEHINGSEESDGIPTQEDEELFGEIVDCDSEYNLSIEYVKVLSEMKVIYLFKTVEIAIKSLIKTAYPKIDTKIFYRWDSMLSYFKSIDIKISSFDGYKEVTELKDINNNIKHDEIIKNDVKKIKEFVNENQFTYLNIKNFYNRIKPKIQKFVKLLGEAIIEDLYVFDDGRIEKISKDFKSRMDDKTLQQLATKLTEKYDYIKWE